MAANHISWKVFSVLKMIFLDLSPQSIFNCYVAFTFYWAICWYEQIRRTNKRARALTFGQISWNIYIVAHSLITQLLWTERQSTFLSSSSTTFSNSYFIMSSNEDLPSPKSHKDLTVKRLSVFQSSPSCMTIPTAEDCPVCNNTVWYDYCY